MEVNSLLESIKKLFTLILNKRFSYLFFTIILLFLLRPFIEGATTLNFVTNVFLWFVVISCVWAVHEERKYLWFVMTLAAAAILAGVMHSIVQNSVTSWLSKITLLLFLIYAVVAILLYLVRQDRINSDMIMAAASEYVLIGIMWTFLYGILETLYPGSFSFTKPEAEPSGFLYYSFVTLTTTGYGDILPTSVQARSLAVLEMITGQLFIAITVARIVGLYTASNNKDRS
jgi:hypothetical protein